MWDFITTTTGKRNTKGNYSDKPPYTDPYVRWCEGTAQEIILRLLLNGSERCGDLTKQEAAAAAVMLEDANAGAASEKIFAEAGVEGGVDDIGDQDEVNIGVREEGARLVGVGTADGMVGCRLVVIEEAEDDFEDLGIFTDDQNIDRMGDGN